MFQASVVEANASPAVFAKYPNAYFVETGNSYGDGIRMALNAGFKNIYSIELGPHLYKHCRQRFHSQPSVHLVLGDSAEMLSSILQQINSAATFWLDGHYSCGCEDTKGKTNTPLLEELEAIKKHSIKTHTILIDDVRCLRTSQLDFITVSIICKKILEINPKYTFAMKMGWSIKIF